MSARAKAAVVSRNLPPLVERAAAWAVRLQALLLCLPALYLAWPGPFAPLTGDPDPELTGAGRAALAALVPAGLVLVRRATPRLRALPLWLALLAIALLARILHPPLDTLGWSRAALVGATATALLVAGSTLDGAGRRWLARALPVVSLLASVPALLDRDGRFSGPLGNSGSAAGLALPGALSALWLLRETSAFPRVLGAAAALACSLQAGLAPVLAVPVVGSLALALHAWCRRREHGSRAPEWIFLALLWLPFASGLLLRARGAEPPAAAVEAELASGASAPPRTGDLGGLAVRASVARAALAMGAQHWTLGVGLGQFAAEFPAWREASEIERSTHGRRLAHVETEVWHAHDDWLQVPVELGLIGGLPWLAFLLVVSLTALRALAVGPGADSSRAELGLGALALLLYALVRAPLTFEPASSALAFGLFGALLAREGPHSGPIRARLVTYGAFLLLALQGTRALGIALAGQELAPLWPHALRGLDPAQRERLEYALRLCPDSSAARAFLARELGRSEPGSERAIAAWDGLLELRRHSMEGLQESAKQLALAGRFGEARARLSQALGLDPLHPTARRNLALMELRSGGAVQALARIRELRAQGVLSPREVESWALERAAELDFEPALELLAGLDLGLESGGPPSPQRAFDLGTNLREAHPLAARALIGFAQVSWGREHVLQGRADDALRSYRQAARQLESESAALAPSLAVEVAAVEALSGATDAARVRLEALRLRHADFLRLPAWAGDALKPLGLFERLVP